MDIAEIEITATKIQIKYADGSREEIDGGIYERKNTNGDTVEQRAATAADLAALTALAEEWEASLTPSGDVTKVKVLGDNIDVYFDDGTKLSIDAGVFEIKDANNDTVFERPATAEDVAYLFGLSVGDPGAGTGGTGGTGGTAIDGTAGDDEIEGSSGSDIIDGLGGDDRIRGRGGEDEIFGGEGNDRLRGDGGNDIVDGGAGNDRVRGNSGDDIVHGGDGDDRVEGGSGNDIVSGDAGNDKVKGGSGNDIVNGGTGDDLVAGNTGDDIVNGGAGSDIYKGGLGADVFVFEADGVLDKIRNWEDGADVIDLSAFGLSGFDALSMTQTKVDHVQIDLGGGDVIDISDVTLDQLSADDFIF